MVFEGGGVGDGEIGDVFTELGAFGFGVGGDVEGIGLEFWIRIGIHAICL